MKTSAIGWTDYSGGDLNFVTGCTPVSAGCANCYARAIYRRFGRDHSVVATHPDKLTRLAGMRFPTHSPKRGPGHKPMAFVCDTGDLFHEAVPDAFVGEAIEMMARRKDVVWQVLTKRPERTRHFLGIWEEAYTYYPAMMMKEYGPEFPFPNIWLGVTAENQATADERIPLLLDTPAAVRFVSVEPMLGPVDMCKVVMPDGDHLGPTMNNWGCDARLDWIICGAESGPDRRPFDPAWAADLYRQCSEAGVAFFGKQASGPKPGVPLLIDGEVRQAWPE